MNFITVEKGNDAHRDALTRLMLDYIRETDGHMGRQTPEGIVLRVTDSMIDKLNEDRVLLLLSVDGVHVGFFYAKIDRHGDCGEIRPDWGYIMEFYVSPEYRRRGLGRQMVRKCEDFFAERGADSVWLTADGVTGEPFWLSVGYEDSGEVSEENGQRIFFVR